MEREKFIAKFRKKLGCKGESKVCWCITCATLSQIYDYVRKQIAKEIKESD